MICLPGYKVTRFSSSSVKPIKYCTFNNITNLKEIYTRDLNIINFGRINCKGCHAKSPSGHFKGVSNYFIDSDFFINMTYFVLSQNIPLNLYKRQTQINCGYIPRSFDKLKYEENGVITDIFDENISGVIIYEHQFDMWKVFRTSFNCNLNYNSFNSPNELLKARLRGDVINYGLRVIRKNGNITKKINIDEKLKKAFSKFEIKLYQLLRDWYSLNFIPYNLYYWINENVINDDNLIFNTVWISNDRGGDYCFELFYVYLCGMP